MAVTGIEFRCWRLLINFCVCSFKHEVHGSEVCVIKGTAFCGMTPNCILSHPVALTLSGPKLSLWNNYFLNSSFRSYNFIFLYSDNYLPNFPFLHVNILISDLLFYLLCLHICCHPFSLSLPLSSCFICPMFIFYIFPSILVLFSCHFFFISFSFKVLTPIFVDSRSESF